MEFTNLFNYFRDCYQADNGRATIWNIFQQNIEHRIFLDEEQILTGLLSYVPIDPDDGRAARSTVYIYRKEKELIYCSLFLVGSLPAGDEDPQAVCSPLLIAPAEILEIDGNLFLKPDLKNLHLNYLLLRSLEDRYNHHLIEPLSVRLSGGCDAADFALEIGGTCEAAIGGLNWNELARYPKLVSERDLRGALKSVVTDSGRPWRLLPASGAAIIKKSVEIRGVLNELAEIGRGASVSPPLRLILGCDRTGNQDPVPAHRVGTGPVPAVLSSSQRQILKSAAAAPMTLVIGPPGTGKSFTIAAIAMEHLTRGQTVLICSKMSHAVDVVGNKIEQQLGISGCVIRAGADHLRNLKRYLEQLLSGAFASEPTNAKDLSELSGELRALDRSIAGLEAGITRYGGKEVAWGRVLATSQPPGFSLAALRARYVKWRVGMSPPLWDLTIRLEKELSERVRKAAAFIKLVHRQRVDEALRQHRPDFTAFLAALRARTGGKQEALFNTIDFRILLSAFPVWLSDLSGISDVLPSRLELFDVAIIDEATQCDIASCLPALQRAKRAVIVGDPNQLRHLSFLSKQRQAEFAEKYSLPSDRLDHYNYREKSILDLVNETLAQQSQVSFLDEHFRSAPPIINFSNHTFYAGRLRVLTENPALGASKSLNLFCVDGERNQAGENRREGTSLVEHAMRQIESEKALVPEMAHSIGLLSPFRGQVDYLSGLLEKSLPLELLQKHNILTGTAHTFQGEQRDIMFLSFVVDAKANAASLRFLERLDVFNVSITRARIAQHVYVSLKASDLDRDSLLGAYLRYIASVGGAPVPSNSAEPIESWPDFSKSRAANKSPHSTDGFLAEVKGELDARGYKTWTAYPIAGLVMDIMAARGSESFGIDLIGYPGEFADRFPLDRYKTFQRAGLRIIPLPYSRWVTDREGCLRAIDSSPVGHRPGSNP